MEDQKYGLRKTASLLKESSGPRQLQMEMTTGAHSHPRWQFLQPCSIIIMGRTG